MSWPLQAHMYLTKLPIEDSDMMKCPKCGNENNPESKFCKNCGNPLDSQVKTSTNNSGKEKKIIIGLIIVIVAILAIGTLYGMGVFKGEVPLETKDFDAFKLDVPVGSEYVLKDSSSKNKSNLFVCYQNKGDYEFDAFGFYVGNNITKKAASWNGELYEKDGKIEIYKNDSSTGAPIYSLYYDSGDGMILIIGSNTDTMKKMAKSLKDFDESKLASNYNDPSAVSSSSSSSAPASSTPSSISILGGSFSTGSADEDKTYARINVGTAHAGEDVIVQIYYSRDGNSLNNGNMVPATVHSDGYLEIASADAYKYYPDYATINIYDSNSNLLTTKSVSLSPSAGTQTF